MLIDKRGRLKLSDFGLSSCRTPLKKERNVDMTPNQTKSIEQKIVYGKRLPSDTPAILQKNSRAKNRSPIKFPRFSDIDTLEETSNESHHDVSSRQTDEFESDCDLCTETESDDIGILKRQRELVSSESIEKPDKKKRRSGTDYPYKSTGVTREVEEIEINRGSRRSILVEASTPTRNLDSSLSLPCPTPQRTPRRTSRRSTLQTRGSLKNAER